MQPGRSCPLSYRYSPADFARPAEIKTDTVYVIGGLYGNVPALEIILDMAARESATLVFNGDFNWFNINDAGLKTIARPFVNAGSVSLNGSSSIMTQSGASFLNQATGQFIIHGDLGITGMYAPGITFVNAGTSTAS